jgi:HlyD family secretion protein
LKRWLWILILAGLAAGGIFLGFWPQPVSVEAAKVTTGPLRVTVEEEGKTRLRSRYVVSSPVAGYTPRLKWKAGDAVRAGETITSLEPPPPAVLDARTREQGTARVKAAEATFAVAEARVRGQEEQLRVAQANLQYWRSQRDRNESLRRTGDIATEKVERDAAELRRVEASVSAAERAILTARAEVESARAEVAAARSALRQTTAGSFTGERIPVTAPAAGRVIRVVRESEGLVTPGEPLLEIGNANALEIVVELLSADAVKVGLGTRVILTRWGGEKPLEARVRVIEPGGFTKVSALGVEEQRVRVVADLVSPETEWQALGDGYRVEAAFVLWESNAVLQVPANTLFRHQEKWRVFVVENGIARRRGVEVGHRNALAAEVISGLKEGDVVINHPDETVEDGKAVAAGR